MRWLSWLARPDPARLAAAILSLACPVCAAPGGAYCDPWSGAAGLVPPPCGLCGNPPACRAWCDAAGGLAVISADPLAVLHDGRILAAAGAGLVSRRALRAQFGAGEAPPSITRQEQEARTL